MDDQEQHFLMSQFDSRAVLVSVLAKDQILCASGMKSLMAPLMLERAGLGNQGKIVEGLFAGLFNLVYIR